MLGQRLFAILKPIRAIGVQILFIALTGIALNAHAALDCRKVLPSASFEQLIRSSQNETKLFDMELQQMVSWHEAFQSFVKQLTPSQKKDLLIAVQKEYIEITKAKNNKKTSDSKSRTRSLNLKRLMDAVLNMEFDKNINQIHSKQDIEAWITQLSKTLGGENIIEHRVVMKTARLIQSRLKGSAHSSKIQALAAAENITRVWLTGSYVNGRGVKTISDIDVVTSWGHELSPILLEQLIPLRLKPTILEFSQASSINLVKVNLANPSRNSAHLHSRLTLEVSEDSITWLVYDVNKNSYHRFSAE